MAQQRRKYRPESETTHENGKLLAAILDPATSAIKFLQSSAYEGFPTLRFHRGEFLLWRRGCYRPIEKTEVRGLVVRHLNQDYAQLTTGITANVLDQVKALALLPASIEPNTWIKRDHGDYPANEIIAAINGLVHLPKLGTDEKCLRPATPRFFAHAALEFSVDPKAGRPVNWLAFLDQVFRDDPEAIDCLQCWFGYCVAGGTYLQKIFALIGPKRSGKGTIARVLRALVGPSNVAGPTLSSLSTNFGLWALVGKSLAIISDARVSRNVDQAISVERLLSISGEDALTIDRKNLEPITEKLPTRIMLISNELLSLPDASGAMASRIMLLRLTQSYFGREDHDLTDKLLAELPGILLWAVEGWRRLRERGRLIQPESAREMIDDLEELGSPISAFVRERCIVEPGFQASVADLFTEWRAWCEASGRRSSGTQQMFGRDLTAAVPAIRKTQPRADDGGRYRAYDGIGLRTISAAGGF